jgi:hypothetical protein
LLKDGSQTLLGAQTLLQLASSTSVVNPINGDNEVSLLADVLRDISFEYDEAYVEGTTDVDDVVADLQPMGGVSMDDFLMILLTTLNRPMTTTTMMKLMTYLFPHNCIKLVFHSV